MKVSQIYIYPIKSLRGVSLPSAHATRKGFKYDRRFMLLKVIPAEGEAGEKRGETTLKNMHVPHFPEMALFGTELFAPDEGASEKGRVRVTFYPPGSGAGSEEATGDGEEEGKDSIEIPLKPDTRGLEELAVVMHKSPTKGYNMGSSYNEWFSERFGYDVVLAYLGDGDWRPVLGTFAPGKHVAHKGRQGLKLGLVAAVLLGVLGLAYVGVTVATSRFGFDFGFAAEQRYQSIGAGGAVTVAVGLLTYLMLKTESTLDERITFADTAPYMVVSEKSVANVTGRLEDEEMDVRKFRSNIVVEGAETAWEEDFWAELVIGDAQQVRLLLTANCVRCRSLDVDYSTGKMGTGESGKVLKKLMSDRRVDTGAKYSPVFGRYGFLSRASDSKTVRVGDSVTVARGMKERAIYGESAVLPCILANNLDPALFAKVSRIWGEEK